MHERQEPVKSVIRAVGVGDRWWPEDDLMEEHQRGAARGLGHPRAGPFLVGVDRGLSEEGSRHQGHGVGVRGRSDVTDPR